jgi:hypothetical protein
MKLIKQGLPKEEVERIAKATKRFTCKRCGCIFEADKDEYSIRQCGYNETEYYCICPNCEIRADESDYVVDTPTHSYDEYAYKRVFGKDGDAK